MKLNEPSLFLYSLYQMIKMSFIKNKKLLAKIKIAIFISNKSDFDKIERLCNSTWCHKISITLVITKYNFIVCTRNITCLKSGEHNTILEKTYKQYSKNSIEEWLTKIKFPDYLSFPCVDSAYNHLSTTLQNTKNETAPTKDICIKRNMKS